MAMLRVVLAEGHHGVRDALARRLARLPGVEVIGAAGDLETTLAFLAGQPPAVVLCDPRSLSDTPVDIVRCMRRRGAAVVVLTTSLIESDSQDFLAAGAAAVLLKGCSMEAIHAALLAAAPDRLSTPFHRLGAGGPPPLVSRHALAK